MMSPEAEALLAKGRASPPRPSDEARARMRRQILARAGAAAVAGATVVAVSKASTGLKAGLVWKIVGALTLTGGLTAGIVSLRSPDPEPARLSLSPSPSPESVSPSPESVPVPVPVPDLAPDPDPAQSPSPSPSPSPQTSPSPSPKAPSSADSLAEETLLLADAQRAFGSGDHARTLALTSEHARRFPKGALSAERHLLRALALCASGNNPAGINEGRAAFPDESSGARKRIESACQ